MEPWLSEHALIIEMLAGVCVLILGSYGFTWICYILLNKSLETFRLNEVPHLRRRLRRMEEALKLRPYDEAEED